MPAKKSLWLLQKQNTTSCIPLGVSNLLAYLGHTGSRVILLGHTFQKCPTGYESTPMCIFYAIGTQGLHVAHRLQTGLPWKTSVKVALTLSPAVSPGEGKSL